MHAYLYRALSCCMVELLRGRKTVRADHRLRTDEKHIRTQSAILHETPTPCLGLTITAFSVRMRFLSVRKTRLARAARKSAFGTRRSSRRGTQSAQVGPQRPIKTIR